MVNFGVLHLLTPLLIINLSTYYTDAKVNLLDPKYNLRGDSQANGMAPDGKYQVSTKSRRMWPMRIDKGGFHDGKHHVSAKSRGMRPLRIDKGKDHTVWMSGVQEGAGEVPSVTNEQKPLISPYSPPVLAENADPQPVGGIGAEDSDTQNKQKPLISPYSPPVIAGNAAPQPVGGIGAEDSDTQNKQKPLISPYSPPALAEDPDSQNTPKFTSHIQVLSLNENVPSGFDLNDEDKAKFNIWPQGVIPYYMDGRSFDKVLRDKIRYHLHSVNDMTGLRFTEIIKPPEDDKRYVFFINRRAVLECPEHTMSNFTSKGVQKFVLGYDCLAQPDEMAANILALVGVPPQHNAPNRDEYLTVVESNILPEKKNLFQKLSDKEWLFHDLPYDINSASHYHSHKHTANGKASFIPKEEAPDRSPEGDGEGFSKLDIQKIKMIYGYITTAQNPGLSQTQCSQLFVPGVDLDNYKPSYFPKKKPLPKPYQYTGEQPPTKVDSDENEAVKNLASNENVTYSIEKLAGEQLTSEENLAADAETDKDLTGEKFTDTKNKLASGKVTDTEKVSKLAGKVAETKKDTIYTGEKFTDSEKKTRKRYPRQVKHIFKSNIAEAEHMSAYEDRFKK